MGKRKTTELSPRSVQEREASTSQKTRARAGSPTPSLEVPIFSREPSFSPSSAMPPPSSIYSHGSAPYDPFYVRSLEDDLRASREDLSILARRYNDSLEDITRLVRRQKSRESLLQDEIAALKTRLGEGSSRGSSGRRGSAGGSSGKRGGAGSSSGRR